MGHQGAIMRFSHSFLCGVACVASVSCADPEPLALSTVSPPLGPTEGGTLVKITGENLRLGSQVTFGGTPALAVEFIDAEELRVVTPPGTEGAVDVSVTSPSGEQETLSGAFTYVAEPQQTLCEVAVSHALGTQNVDVTTTFSATYSESVDASM